MPVYFAQGPDGGTVEIGTASLSVVATEPSSPAPGCVGAGIAIGAWLRGRRRSGTVSVRVRMTPEYKAWLEEAAAHCRATVAGLLDQGAILAAKHHGFRKPPPGR